MNQIEWQTPVIEGYGKVKFYPQSGFLPTNDREYKLIFNISSNEKKEGVNAALWRIARAINLFKAAGIDADNLKLAAIIYGDAWPAVLIDEKHQDVEGTPNPNTELIGKLVENKVKIYICGQSIAGNNIEVNELNPNIDIALSALVAFPAFDAMGYTLIP